MASVRKKPLTQRDIDRSHRLRLAWDRSSIASQKTLAASWGVTVGNLSQYLNGHIPLNVEAQLQFARHLRVSPVEIWPDFEFHDLIARPDESLSLLSDADRAVVRALITSLQQKRA
jgi:DNA-binding transcriptional regulator YdaS (Cro superfamily)